MVNAGDIPDDAARNVCIRTVLGIDDDVDHSGCTGGGGERCRAVSGGEEATAAVLPRGPEKLQIEILFSEDGTFAGFRAGGLPGMERFDEGLDYVEVVADRVLEGLSPVVLKKRGGDEAEEILG